MIKTHCRLSEDFLKAKSDDEKDTFLRNNRAVCRFGFEAKENAFWNCL